MNVDELIAALEAADVTADGDDLESMIDAMERRAPLIAAVAALDPSSLSDAERAAVAAALGRLRDDDARLRELLEGEQRGVQELLGAVRNARGAVRGYRGPEPGAGSVLRSA